LRRGLSRHKIGLKRSTKVKIWREEEGKEGSSPRRARKENRIPTVLKKNKHFIDKIDPTGVNITIDYLNPKSSQNNEQRARMSFMVLGDITLADSSSFVTAKLTNSVSVGYLHQGVTEKIGGILDKLGPSRVSK